ncbi:MAG: NADH-quinone oxidoreductase subunit M [Gemmataceae bacterium]|nr:NADH-quinone oxidoreductase subunit M [Gemmataceae bacterium]
MNSLVLAILIIPLAASAACFLLRKAEGSITRSIALAVSLALLALTSKISWDYLELVSGHSQIVSKGNTFAPVEGSTVIKELFRFQPATDTRPDAGVIRFYLGIDGLNVFILQLTTVVFLMGVIAGWKSVKHNPGAYYGLLFFLEFSTLGAFLSFDLVFFYIFFELTIVPLFFLIGMWGGPNRQYAAKKLFMYTLAGGLMTLLGLIALVTALGQNPGKSNTPTPVTFSIPDLVSDSMKASALVNNMAPGDEGLSKLGTPSGHYANMQKWIFLALILGFAIKVPAVPFHTWQPTAYFEASTPITLIMSGILAKLGVYGFLRIVLPLVPMATMDMAWLLGWLGAIGILYGAGCAIAQDDFKKMAAYSSLSHLGFCLIGIFALNETGITGGVLQMINHGLITGALLFLIAGLGDRYGTTRLKDLGGLGARLKVFAGMTMFFCMCGAGLPLLNGFVGEIMALFGMFDSRNPGYSGTCLAAASAFGMVLGAWYLLNFLMKVFFGPVEEPPFRNEEIPGDLSRMEKAILFPLAAACLYLGCFPQPVIETIRPEVRLISKIANNQVVSLVKEAVAPALPKNR